MGARGRAGRDGTGSISLVNGGRGWREWNNGSEVKPVPAAQPAAAPLHGGVGLVVLLLGPGGARSESEIERVTAPHVLVK